MKEYSELVKALRDTERVCRDRMDGQVMLDAAAAIEEIDAEETRLLLITSELQDKVVELEGRLTAEKAQLPKRGEIVRCKECKWYGIYYAKKDGTPDKRYSPSVCLRGKYAKRRDPEWFCADGEREEQDGANR